MGIATTSLRTGLAMTRFNMIVIPRSEATWESPTVFRRFPYNGLRTLQRNSMGIATTSVATLVSQ